MLLIVVGFIAIISVVSIGYFGGYVITSKRTEARSALTQTAGSLEKCKGLYGFYNNANCNVAFPINSDSNLYSITGAVASSTFTLTATPVAGKSQANDSDCTTFTLSNIGIKGATGVDTTVCW